MSNNNTSKYQVGDVVIYHALDQPVEARVIRVCDTLRPSYYVSVFDEEDPELDREYWCAGNQLSTPVLAPMLVPRRAVQQHGLEEEPALSLDVGAVWEVPVDRVAHEYAREGEPSTPATITAYALVDEVDDRPRGAVVVVEWRGERRCAVAEDHATSEERGLELLRRLLAGVEVDQ